MEAKYLLNNILIKPRIIFLAVGLCTFSNLARAQESQFKIETPKSSSASEDRNLSKTKVVTINTKEEDRSFKGAVSFQHNQLAAGAGEDAGNQYAGDLDLNYISKEPGSTEKVLDFAARVNDASLVMFSVKELYIGSEHEGREDLEVNEDVATNWKAGRVILNWSTLDEKWGFGKVNNRVNFDYFNPGQEGLVGLVNEFHAISGIFAKTFVSGFYVPELNPSMDIDVDNGTIKSRHPWVKAPAATTEQGGSTKELYYNVQYPDTADIVLNPSIGLSVGYEDKHVTLEAFYMRKPDNKIGVAASPKLTSEFDKVVVAIEPGVFYHDVAGGQLTYHNSGFELYTSYLFSKPDAKFRGDVDFYNTTQYKHVKIKEEYGGVGMARDFSDNYRLELNYVARRSRFQDKDDNPLEEEPRWNEAVNIKFAGRWSKSFSSVVDLKYDVFTEDRLYSFSTKYKFNKDIDLLAGFDIIGSNDVEETYWSPFRNNDSVYGKMTYRF